MAIRAAQRKDEQSFAFVRKLASAGQGLTDFSADDAALLDSLCEDVRDFDDHRDIIREGARPNYVHIMIEGWSCRYKVLPDGSRQITAFLIPGDICDAHITLFHRMDHSIGALTDCRVALVAPDKMRELAARPRIAHALWWASLVDEAVLLAWIVNHGRRDAFERIGNLFCELHARMGNVGLESGGSFELPLTQEELGDATKMTSVHTNRTLKRLREEGLLTFRDQRIVISDVSRLQRLVGFDANYLHLPSEPRA